MVDRFVLRLKVGGTYISTFTGFLALSSPNSKNLFSFLYLAYFSLLRAHIGTILVFTLFYSFGYTALAELPAVLTNKGRAGEEDERD